MTYDYSSPNPLQRGNSYLRTLTNFEINYLIKLLLKTAYPNPSQALDDRL